MDKLIGPALPPHLMNCVSSNTEEGKTDCSELVSEQFISETDVYGPALPPHLRKQKKPDESLPSLPVVGPCLPPEMVTGSHEMNSPTKPTSNDIESEDSEDDVVGPPIPGSDSHCSTVSLSQQKLELRAQYLKRKLAEEGSLGEKKRVTERESWMLELPPERAVNLGLGPRSFRKREGPDLKDRSDWTDTPADRLRKQQLGQDDSSSQVDKDEVMKAAALHQRDEVMERMAESSKDEKRQLSLLEMHQKALLKKQKKEKKKRGDKPPERRPFDRNIDLQANRFDEAQKKSIFKKAQLLDTRFSSGQSKYL